MVTLKKAAVDVVNEQLLISATSKYNVEGNPQTSHYRFTNIYIDTAKTFNCYNDPSDYCTTIPIDIETIGYDTDLVDFSIPFSSILSDDIPNELLFVWLEETEYNNIEEGSEHIKDVTGNPDKGFCVTLSVSTLYELLLNHIKVNTDICCNTTCSDINYVLAWNGFNLAKSLAKVTPSEYRNMIYYWSILHKKASENSNECTCK